LEDAYASFTSQAVSIAYSCRKQQACTKMHMIETLDQWFLTFFHQFLQLFNGLTVNLLLIH